MSKVWFITGTSRGLGRALVDHALAQGDKVVATARNPKVLEPLQAQYPDTLLLYPLDVTDSSAARAAVSAALDKFDHIDLLVNNAGYANIASVEHMAEEDFRAQVDTNFFGVVNVTKAVLPHFRARRAGHIFQVSSIASRGGTPGLSAYQASKFAVSGFSISLAAEVAPFNIKVTSLEPGAMQTDWMGSSMKVHDIDEAYRETVGSIAGHVGNLDSGGVAASGGSDIAKIGSVIETLYKADDPPVRVLLGKDAVNYGQHFSQQQAESDVRWKELSESTSV
ncbi:dehydrogenase/reductase SDR family member [Verticillium alfalfae VaMs.102]|uniref:Dehydrogenase/reductase SDR family member n=1 Tax=Verticillium alfalfae (strain VaMs.102 / ATCC MYA-4576 / FGSC 10136) TaxID=526221 RepID=C9SXX2_VERA1|nr:dehydrogenase/reductase SDR family member [Verticillium alfalfae VaMs.102]EEY23637.1 dehydrogenase/reductase SDR family member [Verticillium alfalfae VaMs.102]